jgi:hypothetical protein
MANDDRSDLREAATELDAAREAAADAAAADRLESLADRVRSMADADRGPDHGQLDRLMHSLREVEADLDGEAVAAMGSAIAHVRAYRETVEGV